MQTNIHSISEVTLDLEIEAAAEDLASDFNDALRRRRARTEMKGFRPGKVPLHLVKRIHGEELASLLAHNKVMETFHTEIVEKGDYDVVGRPMLTSMEYEMDGDLRAVVRFGIRPDIALKDLSREKILRFQREVTDEYLAENITRYRKAHATLVPLEDEEIKDDFQVVLDMQRLDDATGAPVIGEKREGVTFFMDQRSLLKEIREAVLGKRAGETCMVELPPEQDAEGPARRYEATIRETLRRDLPDLDDAFAEEITNGRIASLDEWKEELREELVERANERKQRLLAENMVERILELHDIPVPESAVELHLDDFLDSVKRNRDGKFPEHFDVQAFRESQRPLAARHAKWGLLRDAYIEQEQLEVTEDDLDDWFDKAAAEHEEISGEALRRYYERIGNIEEVRGSLLHQKFFARLGEMFEIEDRAEDDDNEQPADPTSPSRSRILLPM